MEKESVLQNAGGGIMLIKAFVQWLETVPLKEAFIPHTGLQSRYFGGQQSAGEALSCLVSAGVRHPQSQAD